MTVVSELTSQAGVAAACQALAVPRSSFYRSRQAPSPKVDPPSPPARSPRALRRGGAVRCQRDSQQPSLSRSGAARGLRYLARRGALPLLLADDVPHS
jgi:hypothetical protein